jgi:GNAT superfamily N-acetyltransferase
MVAVATAGIRIAPMDIEYKREHISVDEFAQILLTSGLAERRPADDPERLGRMVDGASLIISARDPTTGLLVGVARSLTDWAYACYLSDLAVHRDYVGQGIGTRLIELTREAAGEESMCLLVASPDAAAFYRKIGMPETDRAFLFPRTR